MLIAIDDDELEGALLGAVGERRTDVGVIRGRGSIEVVGSSTGRSVALGTGASWPNHPRSPRCRCHSVVVHLGLGGRP